MFRVRRFSVINTANMPMRFGLAGRVFTALLCLLYNRTARYCGEIGADVESRALKVQAPPTCASPTPQQG